MKPHAYTGEIPDDLVHLLDNMKIPFAYSGYAPLQQTLELTGHRLLAATLHYQTQTGDATLFAKISDMDCSNIKTIHLYASGTQTIEPRFYDTEHQEVLRHNEKTARLAANNSNDTSSAEIEFPVTNAIVLTNPILNEQALFEDGLVFTEESFQVLAAQTLSKQWLAFRDPAIAHNLISVIYTNEYHKLFDGVDVCEEDTPVGPWGGPGVCTKPPGEPGNLNFSIMGINELDYTGVEIDTCAFSAMCGEIVVMQCGASLIGFIESEGKTQRVCWVSKEAAKLLLEDVKNLSKTVIREFKTSNGLDYILTLRGGPRKEVLRITAK